jgi:hypothetical protein
LAPQALFKKGGSGFRAFPVNPDFQDCLRESVFAIEGSFHRYIAGDYHDATPAELIGEARRAVLEGNIGRAHDRATAAGANILAGGFLPPASEWVHIEPLYSWLLGLERIQTIIGRLEGWPGGRYSGWNRRPLALRRRIEKTSETKLTPSRRGVLKLLAATRLKGVDLARIKRNRAWIGTELIKVLRMRDDSSPPELLRNTVRALGAITYLPAADDLLALLMRHAPRPGQTELLAALETALQAFGPGIRHKLVHYARLALEDEQRLALARLLACHPDDDEVMGVLERFFIDTSDPRNRARFFELVTTYPHPRRETFLREQVARATRAENVDEARALLRILKTKRTPRKRAK